MRPSDVRHGGTTFLLPALTVNAFAFAAPAASQLLPDGSSSFMKTRDARQTAPPGSVIPGSEQDVSGLVASSVYHELLAPRGGTDLTQDPAAITEIVAGSSSWRSVSARELRFFGRSLYANIEPRLAADPEQADPSGAASSDFPDPLLVVVLSAMSLGVGIWAWDREKREELYESFIETHP
jgi:hypothetical protein